MDSFAKLLRFLFKVRFKILKLATINDIPTEKFNNLIENMISDDWKKTYEYSGFDAWIDYGKIKLRRGSIKIIFEWDNWTEGSIEGPIKFVEIIAKENNLKVTHAWRWSEYDDA